MGINFGYSIDLNNKIKIGGVVQNLGKMTKLQTDEILLPRRVIVGLSRAFTFNQIINFVYASLEKNAVAPSAKIHLGNHINWDRFNLYSGVSSSKKVLETSIGFGVLINRFEVMYALRYGSQNIGIPQFITLRFFTMSKFDFKTPIIYILLGIILILLVLMRRMDESNNVSKEQTLEKRIQQLESKIENVKNIQKQKPPKIEPEKQQKPAL